MRTSRLAPRAEPPSRTPRAGAGRPLPATVLALQRTAGNRATRRTLARFVKGVTKTTIEQVKALPLEKQIDFLIAVSKKEQVPEAGDEVRDLHRALVLSGMGRAANRVLPYTPESAFARDVAVLETLGAKLEEATLDDADVTSLIKALRTMERQPAEPPPKPVPVEAPATVAAPVVVTPKKEPEKPKGPKGLDPGMAPSNVEDAIRHYTEGGTDDTGAPVKRSWDTWEMYVSSWDKPKSAGGQGKAWGFSSSHVLAGLAPQKTNLIGNAPAQAGKQKWIIHVHRSAAGAVNAATVQWADSEGQGGVKDPLTAKQLARIGIPAVVDPYAKPAGGVNKVPGVWKYQWTK